MSGLIKYTIEQSRVPEPAGNPGIGYRLKITCTEFTGGPDTGVFCFKRVAAELAQFSHVASYADMEDFAAAVPVDPAVPFFRAAVVDLVFRDPALRDETLLLIQQDFEILTTGVDVTNELSAITYGVTPGPDSVPTSGVISGDGASDTYYVMFPATLSTTPAVYVSPSSDFGFALTVDSTGFVLVASRTLTQSDVVSWHLG